MGNVRVMESTYKEVLARTYFLTPEEGGGRSSNVVVRAHPPYDEYRPLADLGLGYNEDGLQMYCEARVRRLDGPGVIEQGMEHTLRIRVECSKDVLERVLKPGTTFDLTEGRRIVAKATVLTVLE